MGGLSAPAVLGVLEGCRAAENPAWKPQFLSEGQAELVAEVAEIMIPRTATPGAKDVGVSAVLRPTLKVTPTRGRSWAVLCCPRPRVGAPPVARVESAGQPMTCPRRPPHGC